MRHPAPRLLPILSLIFVSGTAFAHPGHGASGFASGLAHPLLGLDHLLAMAAVGLWAAQGGGRRMWLLPAAFMAALAFGATAGMHWPAPTQVETGIAASVLALGLLIALARQLPLWFSLALTALFGVLHGYAHGVELPESAAPVAYAAGFLAATAALHLCGMTAGVAARRRHAVLCRMMGAAIAASGVYLLASA